jgi:adenine-specific DNA-methyltransferase
MATGITKGEQAGRKALTADTHTGEPDQLPPSGARTVLSYPNKLSEAEILRRYPATFVVKRREAFEELHTLEPNAIVACNNIYGLSKALATLQGKITLIYTDPPYATGMGFQSRDLQHAYDDHNSGASYIEFMRRRLILSRELLSEDGSIYVHIGHQMVAETKVLMDEVFGPSNFRNLIARRKCSSKNSTRNSYPNLLDFVLYYTKSKTFKWNQPTEEPTEAWIEREYPKTDKKGRFKLVPIHAPGKRNGATGTAWREMMPPPGKHWQYTPEKLDELDSNGEIHWSKTGNPRRKVYLQANKGLPLTDYWSNFRDAHHQSVGITGYPTEKNLPMVKKIVSASSERGDIVMDPFSGSGTTLHAAEELGRRWLGFDQSLVAVETTVRRFTNGLEPMGDFVPGNESRNAALFSPRITRNFEVIFDRQLVDQHPEDVAKILSIHSD